MGAEADIREYLISQPAVTTLVGDSIRPDQLVQGVDDYPGITISVDDETSFSDLDGDGGLVSASLAIVAWDTNRTRAREVAEAVRLSLAGKGGIVGLQSIGAYYEGCDVEFVPNDDGSDGGAWAVTGRYTVWFSEVVAFP